MIVLDRVCFFLIYSFYMTTFKSSCLPTLPQKTHTNKNKKTERKKTRKNPNNNPPPQKKRKKKKKEETPPPTTHTKTTTKNPTLTRNKKTPKQTLNKMYYSVLIPFCRFILNGAYIYIYDNIFYKHISTPQQCTCMLIHIVNIANTC